MENDRVLFRFGSRREYDALTEYDSNSLYFLLDTNELYRGEVPIGQSHYREGTALPNESLADSIFRILDSTIPVENDLMTVTTVDGVDDLFVYTGNNTWKQLNATIRSENVIFSDGKTLDEILSDIQPSLNFNDSVFELSDNELNLKNFGKQYYKYIPSTEEVDAHYELVVVDENHPWPTGLTPKTTEDGTLGWYEPNLQTLDGINTTITNLQNLISRIEDINDIQSQKITDLEHDIEDLDGLKEVIGTFGDSEQGTESTGLIKEVEDLKELINASGVQKITIDGVELASVNGTVNLPEFTETSGGLVPAFHSTIASLEDLNPDHVLLSVNGWVDPIGDLGESSTVAEYVDARIEDNTLKWQTIDA